MATLSTFLKSDYGDTYDVGVVTHTASVTTGTATDVVQFVKVRKGWEILDVKLLYTGTASSTAAVGDGDDDDRFITATSTATSGVINANALTTVSAGTTIATGLGYVYTADDTIDIKFGGATVSGKQYTMIVTYKRHYN